MKRSFIVVLLITIPALFILGFVLWATATPTPMPEALAALESNGQVQVDTEEWLMFLPPSAGTQTGVIFYPGGRVDPRAYAPAALAIAKEGYPVIIVPMPLNLAVFGADRADEVMAAFPEIENWVLAGHSLGGAMAGRYALENPARLSGLAFWAAYPADTDDLSGFDFEVLSIYGTRDGLASVEEVDASRPLLPSSTRWVALEGGNHAQFGWYGPQPGDLEATISRAEQQDLIIEAMLALLTEVKGPLQ